MFAKINHMAIISTRYTELTKFYEAVFGLKAPAKGRAFASQTVGDGYVGLNIIPKRDGYVDAIDHFGMLVDDVGPVHAEEAREGQCREAPLDSALGRL